MRTPMWNEGSDASMTRDVLGKTAFTTPTSPSPQITVISRVKCIFAPVSIVIVWEKEEADPCEITFALTTLYPAVPARSRTDFSAATCASRPLCAMRVVRSWAFWSSSFLSFALVRPRWATSEKKLPTGENAELATLWKGARALCAPLRKPLMTWTPRRSRVIKKSEVTISVTSKRRLRLPPLRRIRKRLSARFGD